MSDTPITNATAVFVSINDDPDQQHPEGPYVPREIAEQLERENAALRVQVEELDAKWKMAEAQCFDQVGKIGELKRENAALKIERNRLRVVLQDIADASGFDNIGNWARNKAKDAARKEAQPIRVDHSGDTNEMIQKAKEAQP